MVGSVRIYSLAENTQIDRAAMSDNKSGGELDTGSSNKARTTVFVDDELQVEHIIPKPVPTDSMAVVDQSIIDFMAKPKLVITGSWSTASAQAALLYQNSIASLLMANSVWTNKMAGYNLVRGTAVVRMQINANPFQQGKLFMCYIPNAAQIAAVDPSYIAMKTFNITTIRQLPGVELDCRETTAMLTIPYIAPTNYYDIKAGTFDWGQLYVYILSPLKSGASAPTTIDYTLYLSFEDFELAAPTVPQGGVGKRVRTKTFKNNPSSTEMRSVAKGVVEDSLSKISVASGAMSSVPYIGAVAHAASWVTGVASKFAGYFGWSKPNLQTAPCYMTRNFNHYMPNVDGADISMVLATTSTNALSVDTKHNGTDVDQMSWDFLKRVGTVINTLNWTESTSVGASLLSMGVGPGTIFRQDTIVRGGHTVVVNSGPPLYFLSNYFNFWRGSIKVILKFVKTDFHTGRFMVTWTPAISAVTPPVYNGNAQLAMRHIVDLREGSEVCLELPFYSHTNYRWTTAANSLSGQLDITVINQLRCPETCSSDIDVLVYFEGGDNLELQVPRTQEVANVSGVSIPAYPFFPQIGELECAPIGQMPVEPPTTQYAESSIGEFFLSLKQLLARPQRMWRTIAGNEAAFRIYPWAREIATNNFTTGVLNAPLTYGDMYPIFSQMYVYMKGSVRILGASNGSEAIYINNSTALLTDSYNSVSAAYGPGNADPFTADLVNNTPYGIQDPATKQFSAHMPYYNRYEVSVMTNIVGSTDALPLLTMPSGNLSVVQSDATKWAFFRSFGDDFQMSYFIGAPPVLVSYV